ncbi:flavin reductase family protein [Streptomyces sp. NBC_01089]|uniref:flavin reductase family protein n=1 Tax=Streptomyces sp. NBC_01089 TaxID=2903747 RepID=UPI00386858E4|nr:flavin reductase family protein [Streptomyces sp. NBC_01089]
MTTTLVNSGTGPVESARKFRHVLGHYPTGVTVVTALDAERQPVGMTIGSFTSVSLQPALVAFFPARTSSTFPAIRAHGSFCVNVIGAHQEEICGAFSRPGPDRFRGLRWRPAPSGAPILDGAVAWIDCEVDRVDDAGDHHLVMGRVNGLEVEAPGRPLLFLRGGYGAFAPLPPAADAAERPDDRSTS